MNCHANEHAEIKESGIMRRMVEQVGGIRQIQAQENQRQRMVYVGGMRAHRIRADVAHTKKPREYSINDLKARRRGTATRGILCKGATFSNATAERVRETPYVGVNVFAAALAHFARQTVGITRWSSSIGAKQQAGRDKGQDRTTHAGILGCLGEADLGVILRANMQVDPIAQQLATGTLVPTWGLNLQTISPPPAAFRVRICRSFDLKPHRC